MTASRRRRRKTSGSGAGIPPLESSRSGRTATAAPSSGGGSGPTGELIREEVRFRRWLLSIGSTISISRIRSRDRRRRDARVTYRELDGPGSLRSWSVPPTAVPSPSWFFREPVAGSGDKSPARELGQEGVLALPPEEQYLVATGRTYFRDLPSISSIVKDARGFRPATTGCSTAQSSCAPCTYTVHPDPRRP